MENHCINRPKFSVSSAKPLNEHLTRTPIIFKLAWFLVPMATRQQPLRQLILAGLSYRRSLENGGGKRDATRTYD
jgi:hypothetical protein